MAGHSKWKQIKRKKAVTDARRASVTAFLRLICFHLLCPAITELLAAPEFAQT